MSNSRSGTVDNFVVGRETDRISQYEFHVDRILDLFCMAYS